MAITINVNGSLVLDETSGLQIGPDLSIPLADNDAGLSYDSSTNQLTSAVLDAEFLDYLEGLFALDAAEDAALGHAATVGGASSSDSFITVTAGSGETIDNLFFKVSGNGLITTATTLANEALYFHVDPLNSDRAVLTTSETAGAGRIVAAFHLDEADNHLSAQVQMVTFEALRHTNPNNPDEPINFSDVLQVGATGSLSFDFDNLDSGNFLWVAIGTESAGLLVTGRDLNVQDSGGKLGQYIPGGNDDPSDSMNTSQGGEGATIGVNAQHFVAGGNNQNPADGSTAVFTLVRGFVPLPTAAEATSTNQQATGTNVLDIDYGVAGPDPDYINTTGAGLFVSQLTGANADMRISLWSAGGGTTAEEGFAYIGNQATDSAFFDDTAITVGTVTVTRGGSTFVFTLANQANLQGGIKVTFGAGADDNSFTITGLQELDSVNWTTTGGETFNRFQVTALATTGAFDLGRVDILQGFDSSQGLGSHLYVDDDGPTITGPGTQPSLTVDESNFALNDTQDFSGAFTRNFGTDGQALSTPISYALGIGAGASGLIDSLSGEAVVLSLVGGIVFGRTETGGDEVFRVTVDGSGNVTLNQSRAVMHLPENGPDQSTTLASDGLVTLSSTITDRDGDQATASINIGQNLNFEDDFPTASLDRIEGVFATVDETNLGADALVLGSSLLSPSIDYRADGAGSAVYSLDVVSLNGETNLTTTDGQAITLVENGPTEVRGEYGAGQLAFIIVINPDNGSVLLDQIVALYHPDASDPDDSVFLDSGILNMVLTVTDADGDSASDPADIGPALQFKDDGPTATAPGAEPVLIVDETDLDDDATEDFSGVFGGNFGADGESASAVTTYALAINAGLTGLVDTLSDENVVLAMDGADVVGLTETGLELVFRVSVNADGEVTLDQLRAVVHHDANDPDESANPETLNVDNLVTLTATITDGDGDTDSVTIGIGHNLRFEDDGPAAGLVRNPGVFATVDETDLATNATVSGASLLTPSIGFGADGAGGAVYTLDVLDDGPTNLETTDGHAIYLVEISETEVQGQYDGGLVAFVVTIDYSDGSVTLDQAVALRHADASNHDDSAFLGAGFLDAVLTVNDADGDRDSASADIGPALEFQDDGPDVTPGNAPPALTVDESDFGTDDSASFADAFTTDFGEDGAAATDPISYALDFNPGATGLFDTLTGLEVLLSLEGGAVVGRAGGAEVFRVTVDTGTGEVTLDQSRAVKHDDAGNPDDSTTLASNDLITLTATATDGDGDQDSHAIGIARSLNFEDDFPTVTLVRVPDVFAAVDETDLDTDATAPGTSLFSPTINYGADGEGSAVYSLDVVDTGPTNLTTTAGQAISLHQVNATTVEGRYGTNQIAFVVTIDQADGSLTLDQRVSLDHPDDSDHDDSVFLGLGFLNAVLTVTDGDGDSASDPADIGPALEFQDDGPSVTAEAVNVIVDDDGGAGGNDGGTDDDDKDRVTSGSITALFDPGADGLQSYTMSIENFQGAPPELRSQGSLVSYNQTANLLTGYVESGANVGYQAGEDRDVFTFALNVGGVAGDFEFTLIDQIDHEVEGTEDNLELAIGILLEAIDNDGDTSTNAAPVQLTIIADDDSPVVNTADDTSNDASASNAVITTTGATGNFDYAIGFDDREGTDYSEANSDLLVSLAGGLVFNGAPGGSAIVVGSTSWLSEDETQATFSFTFNYESEPGAGPTTGNSGLIVFDKVDGTYTFTLTDPISSFGVISLASALGFTGYLTNSSTVTGSQPPVTVARLADNFFVQFTGAQETGGGTDGNSAGQQGNIANNRNLDALGANEVWSNGDDDAFSDGEIFRQSTTWVSVSGTAAGTAGDTMQGGEVLDFNFWDANPSGFLGGNGANRATTGTMFIEFDALDNGEDLVVVLKLVDKDDPTITTTRAVIVQYQDIFHFAERDQIPDIFVNSDTIDQNDGLIVIESNDYNISSGDNWTIAGAQVVASTEGLTGNAINLNRAMGASGGSTMTGGAGASSFTTTRDQGGNNGGTWDGDVFKIVNIGFLTEITPDSQFNFDVTVVDFDGDGSPSQSLTIDVLGAEAAGATLAAMALADSMEFDGSMAAKDRGPAPLVSDPDISRMTLELHDRLSGSMDADGTMFALHQAALLA